MSDISTRRQFLGTGAALGLTALGMGQAERAQAAEEVKVAAVLSMTGTNSAFGQGTWRGLQTAFNLINEAGGVKSLGKAKISVRIYDTESKPDVAGTQAERAIREGAALVIGCNQSPSAMIASQIAEREQIPFLTSTDFDPKLTDRGFKYFFQTDPFLADHARDMLLFFQAMGKKTGAMPKRLGILSDNTGVGQAAQNALTQYAGQFGFQVAVSDSFANTVTDFSSYIAKMKAAGVEALLGFQTPQPSILIVKAMKEQHFDPIAFGGLLGGQVGEDYLNALGADADYTFCSSPWNNDLKIPGMQREIDAFRAQWHENVDDVRAAGFASAAVVWSALERAKSTDRAKLRDAIATTVLDPGQFGFLDLAGVKFDDKGYNTRAAVSLKQIKSGARHSVWPEKYASEFKVVWPKPKWS